MLEVSAVNPDVAKAVYVWERLHIKPLFVFQVNSEDLGWMKPCFVLDIDSLVAIATINVCAKSALSAVVLNSTLY